jgi:glycerol-3-phosphate dehydrogenase
VFVVPWGDLTYIGTTDTDYDGPNEDPPVTRADVDYLLNAMKFTGVTEKDVVGSWAGLRPLVKSGGSGRTADLSRRHKVVASPSGVVSVTGGKLTTYREMAADTVDALRGLLPRGSMKHRSTRRLRLSGAHRASGRRDRASTDAPSDAHLARRYGSRADEVRALVAFDASLGDPLVVGLPYLRAEAVYAARHEMATTLDDVLARRTRAHLLDRSATLASAADVAALMQAELGWSDDETTRQVDRYAAMCAAEELAGDHVANATN